MRRKLFTLAALLLSAVSAFAYEPRIRDIDVKACLHEDGSALVTEKWDVTVASGTEWYLVRSGLGAADITDLNVFDENGQFTNIGKWNIDASIQQKTGKCGLNPISSGYEICWGVGSYGPHQYTVIYRITDAVDILNDADCFHFQMVSPGLTARPEHVKVSISVRNTQLDTAAVKFWGFGYTGATYIEDGEVCFESGGDEYTRNSSIITLLRFEKGLFNGGNVCNKDFDQVKEEAFRGADFGSDDNDEDFLANLIEALFVMGFIFMIFIAPILTAFNGGVSKRTKKKILGCKEKDVPWFRDIPYEGSLFATNYTLEKLGQANNSGNLASAIMLRMIYKGVLDVQKNKKGNPEFAINPNADLNYMTEAEKSFLEMLKTASGEDSVLQEKEFSKWAGKNARQLYNWSTGLKNEGVHELDRQGCTLYSTQGQQKAREALGFKKFLKDFTRMQEKQSVEAVLWQEYLVFASMFGIADKVAKEMKEINPDLYTSMIPGTTTTTFTDIYTMTNMFGRSISNGIKVGNPAAKYSTSYGSSTSSWHGTGGHSSFGGGGGFHGGGFGGGSR